jgi:hypothetical protein
LNRGRPSKITQGLRDEISDISFRDPRKSYKKISDELLERCDRILLSPETIRWVLKQCRINYLPPVETFLLTDLQKHNRLNFAEHHLEQQIDWSRAIFVDESSFVKEHNKRWLWRKRGDHRPEVTRYRTKFPKHVMMFAGISKHYKTPLVTFEGTIDSIVYIDDCVDASGLIPGMNSKYGCREWFLVQDGATSHTSGETMDYLSNYCNVLENWPSSSPDLNPIENLWSIIKRRVEDANPETIPELIEIACNTWEEIEPCTVDHLIDSMSTRLQLCVDNGGGQTKY